MNRAQRRAKPRVYHVTRREPSMIVKLQMLFSPIEALMDEIERTGCTDAAQGTAVFQPQGMSDWYESAPAIFGVVEVFEGWSREHNTALPTDALKRFARKLAVSMPVTLDDISQARAAIGRMKRVPMTREEGYRFVRDCQIRDALERHEPDNLPKSTSQHSIHNDTEDEP